MPDTSATGAPVTLPLDELEDDDELEEDEELVLEEPVEDVLEDDELVEELLVELLLLEELLDEELPLDVPGSGSEFPPQPASTTASVKQEIGRNIMKALIGRF